MDDHYLTLGVGRSASEREIVRAYRVTSGGSRFLWAGMCALLSGLATVVARHLARRQLDELWRWTAHGGRRSLLRSGGATAAYDRIQLADDLTRFGGRAVVVAIPIVFLLVPR